MSTKPSLEATVLAHDALIRAFIVTHQDHAKAFDAFTTSCMQQVHDLNKASPDNAKLVADFTAEWQRLSIRFPKR